METTNSKKHYQKALQLMPGGVNSPVRAFKSVGGNPVFMEQGKGSYLWDVDGNKYIDFCCSWGPLILGHCHEEVTKKASKVLKKGMSFGAPTALENELSELILSNHSYIEKIRFVNSGTEAVMSAIRLARGFTGKNKIIKFEGCYHGHSDSLLVNAGSGLATLGISSSAGVPKSCAAETIVLPLDNEEAVKQAFKNYEHDIACIIIEPIPANNGLLLQRPEYLKFLRTITEKHHSLLIFDEVISGFRIGFEGASGYYNIQPDIITFGKIIGGGLPVGAYAGKKDIMAMVAPEGKVYQAGTLSGNPIAMAAGIAQLEECLKPGFYESLEDKTQFFTHKIKQLLNRRQLEIFSIGSIFWFSFSECECVRSTTHILPEAISAFNNLYADFLEQGLYFGPSGYEVGFISQAHTHEQLEDAALKIVEVLKKAS